MPTNTAPAHDAARARGALRKREILDAAMPLARAHGYTRVRREAVAHAAGCSPGLISHHWGSVKQLKRSIMRHAVATGDAAVVAQGLALLDPEALKAPPEVRLKAAATLL